MFKILLIVFLISMVPLIELRGAIPVGFALIQRALELEESQVLPPFYIVTIYITVSLAIYSLVKVIRVFPSESLTV